MTLGLIAISISVLMHVAWNLMARHVDPRCHYLWWGLLAHLVLFGPIGLYGLIVNSHWNTILVTTLIITAIANSLYFLSLGRAYLYAPVTLIYPLARSSPILIALWSVLFFNVSLSLYSWLGIIVSIAGLILLAASAQHGNTRQALPWAIAAALFTSVYSLSDKIAVNYLPTYDTLLGFVTVGYFASFVTLSVINIKKIGRIIPRKRPAFGYIFFGGLFIGNAYALVIYAMRDLDAAYVVTMTNAGIVIATLLSITLFKERQAWPVRLLAAVIISAGLVLTGLAPQTPSTTPSS